MEDKKEMEAGSWQFPNWFLNDKSFQSDEYKWLERFLGDPRDLENPRQQQFSESDKEAIRENRRILSRLLFELGQAAIACYPSEIKDTGKWLFYWGKGKNKIPIKNFDEVLACVHVRKPTWDDLEKVFGPQTVRLRNEAMSYATQGMRRVGFDFTELQSAQKAATTPEQILAGMADNKVYYANDFRTLYVKVRDISKCWLPSVSQAMLIEIFLENQSTPLTLETIQSKYEDKGGERSRHFRIKDYFPNKDDHRIWKLLVTSPKRGRYQFNPALTFLRLEAESPKE